MWSSKVAAANEEMHAFDELPREVRDALNYAKNDISAEDVFRVWTQPCKWSVYKGHRKDPNNPHWIKSLVRRIKVTDAKAR